MEAVSRTTCRSIQGIATLLKATNEKRLSACRGSGETIDEIPVEAVAGSVSVRKHDLTSSGKSGSRKAVVAFHEQGRDRTRMSRGTFAVDRVRYVGLMVGAVDVLAVPTRREIDLHTNGVTLGVLLEVGECRSFRGATDIGTKMGDMRIEGVAARCSERVASRHSVHPARASVQDSRSRHRL